jgi:hypothetical protein
MAQHGDVDVCFPDMEDGLPTDIEGVVPGYNWKDGQMGVDDKEAGVTFIILEH